MSSFTESDLRAIDAAIKSGRNRVKYGDKEVSYRSMDEMLRARDFIKGQLDAAVAPRQSVSYASFSRD